jgi:hypothetical protein
LPSEEDSALKNFVGLAAWKEDYMSQVPDLVHAVLSLVYVFSSVVAAWASYFFMSKIRLSSAE